MRFPGLFKNEMVDTVKMMFAWTEPYVLDTSKAEKGFELKPTPMRAAVRRLSRG
jgi:hypothetical protein